MKLQHEVDYANPRERVAWALRGMELNGNTFLAPDEVFESWSEHLSKCGFVHVDQVRSLNEDGWVHVDDLPVQEIHYQPPVAGQRHPLNGSGQWVPVDVPLEFESGIDVEFLSPAQRQRLVEQLRERGDIV